MVHFNTKYGTITDAIDKEDGIAVVAILFKVHVYFEYRVGHIKDTSIVCRQYKQTRKTKLLINKIKGNLFLSR